MRTFYLEPAAWQAPFCIEGQEAKHISKVLRLKAGGHIRLLNGEGKIGEFVITDSSAKKISLDLVSVTEHPLPTGRCFLAAAYTKAARRSFMLEKAVELEAGGIWFWQSDYSQAKVPDNAKEHWQEQLVAGAKQSVNPWLPEIKTLPGGASDVCAEASQFYHRYVLWEDAESRDILRFEDINHDEDSLFVMGPEGGLSEREVKVFRKQGFKTVSLGRRVLRWETAAVFCLGLAWWAREVRQSGT